MLCNNLRKRKACGYGHGHGIAECMVRRRNCIEKAVREIMIRRRGGDRILDGQRFKEVGARRLDR